MCLAIAIEPYMQYQEGKATDRYYQAQADANNQQARILENRAQRQSELIQDSAKAQGKQLAIENAQLRGSQAAILAANGIDASSVTGTDIISDTISKQKLDEATLRLNADYRSYETMEQGRFDAFKLNTEAQQLRMAGKNAKLAGRNRAFSTLISNAKQAVMAGAG